MGDMTRLLLLLLWAGVTVSTPVDLQKRIIGGQKCEDDERQYHVKLVDENNNLMCGGSLISDRWILTAAHCQKKGMKAVLGLHPGSGPGQTEKIKSQTIFKEWKYFIFHDKHDIMLLELDVPTKIKPVDLPDCNIIPAVATMVETAGHAATTLDPQGKRVPGESDTLQCVKLEIIANSYQDCLDKSDYIKKYGQSNFKLFQSPMKDVSPGDSGGGVVHSGMIYGVNAFTKDEEYGCALPAGFVDVCGYNEWIEETTGLKFPSKAVGKPNSG